jgi:hypothetical protein
LCLECKNAVILNVEEIFMRILFAAGMACVACALVQCTPRLFNNDSGVKSEAAAEGVKQVDVKAFNAFLLWRDGKGTPVLDYPANYSVTGGKKVDPDGVFYLPQSTYWDKYGFLASVTEGATVKGDILTYPTKEGRTLALKFSAPSEKGMSHIVAVQHCKGMGLRLPHVQELFDFCAAGTPRIGSEYSNNRCKGQNFWSASVVSYDRDYAWLFYGVNGGTDYDSLDRYYSGGVRCVGLP